MTKRQTPRWGWALTGSGHFFKECLGLIHELEHVDLFLSKAGGEVLRMYKQELDLPTAARVYRDTSASSLAVGQFYYGIYHTLIVAPATSNTVAKCVFGISDISHQRLRSGRQVPRADHRVRLRHGAGAGDGSAERHGQGLSAPDRPGEHRAARGFEADHGGMLAELREAIARRSEVAA